VPDESVDVVVYGGTPAGLIAAVAAARLGASTLVLEQTEHVGGLSTSGLVTAESEHMLLESFSGLALEFYQRLGRAYGHAGPLFYWESRLAEQVFADMLAEAAVPVRFGQLLAQVETRAGRVQRIALTDGSTVAGRVFVDASYEGDLMAGAGVAYAVGREGRDQYGESLAGIGFVERPEQVASFAGEVTTDLPVDVCPYDDAGGLLPGVVAADGLVPGAGDRKPMAYNFRLTVSNGPDRVPIQAPPGYDPRRFTLLARYLRRRPATRLGELLAFSPFPSGHYQLQPDGRTRALPGHKWELNNRQNAVISLGHLGGQFAYPEADHAQRRAIWADHHEHNQGLLFFLAHDPDVPAALRQQAAGWGLAPDEYVDHGHWPYYLYVREARRMLGDYVVTQHDIQSDRAKPDAVALGSHWIDSHHVQRVAINPAQFRNEGRIWAKVDRPFQLPYRCLTPQAEQCTNLLVPVCVSASKVGFCPIRLESTWMALGQAAGAAAALAVAGGVPVQELDVTRLQQLLRRAGTRF
jgi:hypothetical protein